MNLRGLGTYLRVAIELLILVGLIYYAYTLYEKNRPCVTPITYKLGAFDDRFGISRAQFLLDLQQGSSLWGNELGHPLFVYDSNGKVTVNLIYDQRQQAIDLGETIQQSQQTTDAVRANYQKLENSYLASKQAYETALAIFNTATDAYNTSVKYWNSRGGAPKNEFQALQDQKEQLITQQTALQTKQTSVNQLANETNALVSNYNFLASTTNATIGAYNSSGLVGKEFDEGEYKSDVTNGQSINIYEFQTKTELVRVIAHEFGHALGLNHDANPDSIMYPTNESNSLKLSPQDIAELTAECK